MQLLPLVFHIHRTAPVADETEFFVDADETIKVEGESLSSRKSIPSGRLYTMKSLQEATAAVLALYCCCCVCPIASFAPTTTRSVQVQRTPPRYSRSGVEESLKVGCCDGSSPAFVGPGARASCRSRRSGLIKLWAAASDEDDDDDPMDEDEPLSKGIESVSWLPSLAAGEAAQDAAADRDGAEVLPLFPLGGIVYTPNSEHILNIFEPRYREMYTDILMNGSKKFVVSMSHPTEPGRFAQMGVLFELEDLKEVSEQTADRIKYICSHKVTGRVKLHRVLNPEAWKSRDTYLRVEGTVTDDSGKSKRKDEETPDDVYGALTEAAEGNPKEEKALRDAFADLVDLQHNLEEDVRFTRASAASLAVKPGPGQEGLWQTIRLWQSFIEQRLMARQNELQREFQERLQDFLKKERGLKEEELPR